MIHLWRRTIPLLLQPPSPPPAAHSSPHFPLLRLLSTTTKPVSPKPFVIEDYLVTTCGLTRAQALRASKRISHLKSPSKPDAVVAFLSSIGVPRPSIANAVFTDARFLCASVEQTLAPRVAELRDLGLSPPQIAHALSLRRTRSLRDNLLFWLPIFGSYDELLWRARYNTELLSVNLEKVAKPNLAFLQQCGISARDIARVTLYSCRLFTVRRKFLQDAVARVEELGVERSSGMFHRIFTIVAFTSRETVAGKMRLLEELGFSPDNVLVIMRKSPQILGLPEENIRRAAEFLMRDVGLEEEYIAYRPCLFLYSLQKRLLPRHFLLKLLREKGLFNVELDYYNTAALAERKFVKKFVHRYEDHIPGLADAYISSCSGEAPMDLLAL